MRKIKTVQEAFELEGLDESKVTVTGIPERHVEAVISIAKLFVIHDAVNPDFQPNFNNCSQRKYDCVFKPGFPSGKGFSFSFITCFYTSSYLGCRLVSESPDAAKYIAQTFPDLYKAFMVYDRPINENQQL